MAFSQTGQPTVGYERGVRRRRFGEITASTYPATTRGIPAGRSSTKPHRRRWRAELRTHVCSVTAVAGVVVFHHALGLTDAVRRFADALRDAGHTVHSPDLTVSGDIPNAGPGQRA